MTITLDALGDVRTTLAYPGAAHAGQSVIVRIRTDYAPENADADQTVECWPLELPRIGLLDAPNTAAQAASHYCNTKRRHSTVLYRSQILLLSQRDNSLAFRKTKVDHRFHYESKEVWYEFGGKLYHDLDATVLAKQLVFAGIGDGTVAWRANSASDRERCESLHALALMTMGGYSLGDHRLTCPMRTNNGTSIRPEILKYMKDASPASRFLNVRSYRFGVGQVRAHKTVHLVADLAEEGAEVILQMFR